MTKSPNITLLLGTAAAGKTEAVLELLREPRQGRALVLVPGRLQQHQFQARLGEDSTVTVHQFYSLTRWILRRAQPNLVDLSESMRNMLLRRVLRSLAAAGHLPNFARVAQKPGFIALVGTLINEAQDAQVSPPALADAGIAPYDAELSKVYAAYLSACEQLNLADIPRRLRLAQETLRTNPRALAGTRLLIVDGFDQFTPLQLSLLAALTSRIARTVITLTGAAIDRPAHRRFIRTRSHLIAALPPMAVQTLNDFSATTDQRPPSLALLEKHLFNLDVPEPIAAGGVLHLIKAADREREVRAALRRVQSFLVSGATPEQIALLYREGGVYVPLLREVAAEYDIPLAIYEGLPLSEAPPIVTFLKLLHLPLEDYLRRDLVEVWRNMSHWDTPNDPGTPTLTNLTFAAGWLDRIGREAGIARGLARLRTTLTALAAAEPVSAEDDLDSRQPDPTVAAELSTLLDAFTAWLTPPTEATISEYVAWARARLERVAGLHAPPDQPDDPEADAESIQPDQQPFALHNRLTAVLNDLAEAATTLSEPPVSYAAFVAELSAAVAAARYGRNEPAAGRIAALPVLAARGLYFDHGILLGLGEGEFPLRLPEPPFYSRRERGILAERGIHLPPPDPADERSLFYETVARARRSLTLARTYLDETGNPVPPSPYLNTLRDLVQPETIGEEIVTAGSVPALTAAASPQEALIAEMNEGALPQTTAQPHASAASRLHSLVDTRLLAHVRRACAVEQAREGPAPYGPYEGRLDAPDLQTKLAQYFGRSHRWSVTQLNDYITCPFRFAAAHVLKLDRRTEPEDGLERSGRGRLYHAILAEAGKHWIAGQYAHTAEHSQTILEILQAAADSVLADAPTRFGFEPGAFWDWDKTDVRRRLQRAIRRVLAEGAAWADFRPAGVEQSFGMAQGAPPLRLKTPAGDVQVIGRIDRIDQRDDDEVLAIIDYKSGSSAHRLDQILAGRDIQLPIYLLAVEQLLAPRQQVERAAFLHLSTGKHSQTLTAKDRDNAVAAAITRVGEVVQGTQSGDFAVRPRDMCPRGCAFATICRLNLAKRDSLAQAEGEE